MVVIWPLKEQTFRGFLTSRCDRIVGDVNSVGMVMRIRKGEERTRIKETCRKEKKKRSGKPLKAFYVITF